LFLQGNGEMSKSARPLVLIATLAMACVSVACASSSSDPASVETGIGVSGSPSGSTPTSPSAASGTAWVLQSMRRPDGSLVPLPAADFTLRFEDGRLAIKADCNLCSGSYSIDGTAVRVGEAMACTRAYCSTEPFATQYTTAIAKARTVLVSERTLTIETSDGTVLVFGR
jgi:heat shock protein HslJ